MEQYLEAADKVLDAAVANSPRPWLLKKRYDVRDEKSVRPTGSVYRHLEDSVAIFSSWASANIQVTLWNFRTHFRGNYRVRISAYAFQTDKPVTFHVTAGTLTAVTEERIVGYHDVPPGRPTVVEFVEKLEAKNCMRIVVDGLGVIPPQVEKVGAEKYTGPGLAVQWVEVEGPLHETWPPPSHRRLFGDLKQSPAPTAEDKNRLEVVSPQPLADAERLLRDFLRRAFRRPVTDDDVRPVLARVKAKLDAGFSFEQAMRVGYKAVLVSPHFLFLRERPGRLDDFALASRLSYFLWSSMPDEELFALAAAGQLRDAATLRRQVERLLSDPKAAAFAQNFAGQWLGLRAIDDTAPDPALYPEYDDILKTAMLKEVFLFFGEVLKHDLSLTNFVASDFTLLNGRLARHYGIPGVTGTDVRRVQYPDATRAGVLGHGSVLATTAHSDQTSPIRRGLFVRRRLLCQEFAPPPPNAGGVPKVDPNATTRERFAQHTQNPFCKSCHQYIDGVGFGFEAFDGAGRFRTSDSGKPIDAAGDMNDVEGFGKNTHAPFSDLSALGRTLAESDAAKTCLVKQYVRFARGRLEEGNCAVDGIKRRFLDKGGDPQEIVLGTILSPDFTVRR